MATKKKDPTAATKPRSKSTKIVAAAPVEPAVVISAPAEVPPVVEAAPPEAPAARPAPSHDAIAARASQIWSERGGSAFDNWLQAERELGA